MGAKGGPAILMTLAVKDRDIAKYIYSVRPKSNLKKVSKLSTNCHKGACYE